MTKDFDEKNWTPFFGYGFSHDTIGRCGDDGTCTPFSVFSRNLDRGSFNGGLDFVIDRASLGSLIARRHRRERRPVQAVPLHPDVLADVAPTVPKGASIAWVNANSASPSGPSSSCRSRASRSALTGRYAHRFDASTLRLEERLYDDSWGLARLDDRRALDLRSREALRALAARALPRADSGELLAARLRLGARRRPGTCRSTGTGDRELGPLWTTEGGLASSGTSAATAEPRTWALQLPRDGMYTAFLDDLYLTHRIAVLGALGFEGTF